MLKHSSLVRQQEPRGRLGCAVLRSLAVTGLAASLLTLPVGGKSFAAELQAPVAEAAPESAAKKCPPTLSEGSRGDNVVYLQDLLNAYGQIWGWPTISADGVYGGETKGMVVALQYREDLKPDGIAGPKTWHALKVC